MALWARNQASGTALGPGSIHRLDTGRQDEQEWPGRPLLGVSAGQTHPAGCRAQRAGPQALHETGGWHGYRRGITGQADLWPL